MIERERSASHYKNAGAYPSQSTAWSGATNSLWWQSNYNNNLHLCASQGATVMRACQTALLENLPVLAYVVNGAAYNRSDIAVDGGIGPYTLSGMIRLLQDMDVPQEISQAVMADYLRLCPSGATAPGARGLPVSIPTQACAIWIGVHRLLPWSSLRVSSNMVTARFDMPPPDDSANAGSISCNIMDPTTGAVQTGGSTAPGGGGSGTPTVPSTSPTTPSAGSGALLLIAGGLILAAAMAPKGRRRGKR